MSTKIWTAWRFPIERLREFQELVKPQMFAEVIKHVENLMEAVKPEAVERGMARYRDDDGTWKGAFSEADTERGVRAEVVVKMIERGRDEFSGSLLQLDCGLNVWIDDGYAYVIPWGQPFYYDALVLPEWAEDYSYQNSVDPPDEVRSGKLTREAYDERGRTWDKAALDNWDAHRLSFRVLDMSRQGMGRSEITLHFLKQARANRQAAEGDAEATSES